MSSRAFFILILLLVTGLTQAQETDASWSEVSDATLHRRSNPSHRRVHDDFQRPLGELREFRLLIRADNVNSRDNIQAVLTHVSNHAYFYAYTPDPVNDPLATSQTLKAIGDSFDRIYAQAIDFWGIGDPPHIEGDRRIVVLLTTGVKGPNYYTSRASMPQESNQSRHETGFVKLGAVYDGYARTDSFMAIMAHEFFHLLHHKLDPDDAGWVKEGLAIFQDILLTPSTLAMRAPAAYLENPRDQLNHFPSETSGTGADYGGGTLFVAYLYERFGRDFLRQFARHPQQGLDAVDTLLAARGAGINADDVFTDWVIANYLLDGNRENGRFGYPQLATPGMRPARRLRFISRLPASYDEFTSRYSADYFELSPAALDESRPLLFRFNPAEPPQDAWLQLVQVLPNAIDVQRFRASQQGDHAIAAALDNRARRVFLAVSPFTPGDRRRTGPVFYSLALSQQQADLTPLTPSTSTAAGSVAAASSSTSLTFPGQVNQPATDLGALGRIFRASHASGPALVVYRFVSAQKGELAFWVTQQEIDAAGVGCVKASADRRIAASRQANNNVVIAMGPDAENKTFHAIFNGSVSGGVSGISTTYDGPPGAGC